jgi:hypothetical protein
MITIATPTAIRIHHTWTAMAATPSMAAMPARSFFSKNDGEDRESNREQTQRDRCC